MDDNNTKQNKPKRDQDREQKTQIVHHNKMFKTCTAALKPVNWPSPGQQGSQPTRLHA